MPSESDVCQRWLDDILHHIELAESFVADIEETAFPDDLIRLYAVTRCRRARTRHHAALMMTRRAHDEMTTVGRRGRLTPTLLATADYVHRVRTIDATAEPEVTLRIRYAATALLAYIVLSTGHAAAQNSPEALPSSWSACPWADMTEPDRAALVAATVR